MSLDLATIAERGGLDFRRRALAPCPVCGAQSRGREDRRGPVAIFHREGEEHWHCKASGCGAGGGPAALLAAIRFREIPAKGDPRWATVMSELDGNSGWIPARSAPARRPAPPATVPNYPPTDEVATVWRGCRAFDQVPTTDPAVGYLRERGIDTPRLAVLDVSRYFSFSGYLPRWVPNGGVDMGVWTALYRLVTPMFDACGDLRSLRFRAIGETPRGKKTLNPSGHACGGLVMADPMGRALLQGRREDDGMGWDGRVVIVEGEPDLWTWSCHPSRFGKPQTWAMLGIAAGSWTDAIAARIPEKARVILRTHHDPPGEKYAEQIRSTLAGRCEVLRSTPTGTRDATETPS